MNSGGCLVLDGVTTFASHSIAVFRFALTLNEDKINVWLEDRSSKKQW